MGNYYNIKISAKESLGHIARKQHKTQSDEGKGKIHPITGHEGPKGE
jgi:hypothetical protein